MPRLILLASVVCLTACITRSPAADDGEDAAVVDFGNDASPDAQIDPGCTPERCGEIPAIACQDGNGEAVRCARQGDVCAWIVECPPPPPVCADEDCGPETDGAACPPGSSRVSACMPSDNGCAWSVDCVPDMPCDCGDDIPQGEPCGPNEEGYLECRDIGPGRCEWFLGCTVIDCGPNDCAGAPPMPNCIDFTAECVLRADACEWEVQCQLPQCEQPWDPGTCRAIQPVWWYDARTNDCVMRDYGGCEGNDNRFETAEACFEACGVLGGAPGVDECVQDWQTRLIGYETMVCHAPDGDGVGMPNVRLLPSAGAGAGCDVAQLIVDGEVTAMRVLTAAGHTRARALAEALRAVESQDPDCDAFTTITVALDGQTSAHIVDRDNPSPEQRAASAFLESIRTALQTCEPNADLVPCR